MPDLNFEAIHSAYREHKEKMGQGTKQPVPQPQGHGPMHSMMVHAMTQANVEPGQDHATMLIRALHELAKKTIPDVSSIHKPQTQGA